MHSGTWLCSARPPDRRWPHRQDQDPQLSSQPGSCKLTTEETAARLRAVNEWLEAIDLVLVRTPVLSRAGEPMPMRLGTVDALHLATALIWRDRMGPLPAVATHDTTLGLAARAFGFDVRGI